LLSTYEDIFGESFWQNSCIVVTRFSESPDQVEIRKEQGLDRETKIKNIKQSFTDHFVNF
jgi:hypothetical protein